MSHPKSRSDGRTAAQGPISIDLLRSQPGTASSVNGEEGVFDHNGEWRPKNAWPNENDARPSLKLHPAEEAMEKAQAELDRLKGFFGGGGGPKSAA